MWCLDVICGVRMIAGCSGAVVVSAVVVSSAVPMLPGSSGSASTVSVPGAGPAG